MSTQPSPESQPQPRGLLSRGVGGWVWGVDDDHRLLVPGEGATLDLSSAPSVPTAPFAGPCLRVVWTPGALFSTGILSPPSSLSVMSIIGEILVWG